MLTIDPANVACQDSALERQIPGQVAVHRTRDVDPAKWLERRASSSRKAAAVADRPAVGAGAEPAARTRWQRVKQFVQQLLTESPDSHIFWVPFACLRGARILLTHKIDVIYCSSPPHSTHLAAFLLAKCFRKPYVLDFRDPWFVNGSCRVPEGKQRWVLSLETFAKRIIVRNAARVISVSEGERDEQRAEFPRLPADRFVSITNGYDPTDFQVTRGERPPSGRLTLMHAGTVYPGAGDEFFAALRLLVRTDPDIVEKMEVRLLGEIAAPYAGRIAELEAVGMVRAYGTVPHAAALQMVLESDVLVILLGGHAFLPSEIPAKVFEYLYAGKPILAVAREGEVTKIIGRSGLGIVASPDSVDRLADTLRRLCADHAAGDLARAPNHSYIRSFERAALAGRLATLLDEAKGPRVKPALSAMAIAVDAVGGTAPEQGHRQRANLFSRGR